MFVKYFIPEDGDEQSHPNVFECVVEQPTLNDLRKVLLDFYCQKRWL